jgi:hypothetical protein
MWYPSHRWVYNKLAVAQSQGIASAPHGVMPPSFPVFSKPIMNLRGMGTGSRVIASAKVYPAAIAPGHFWMELLRGDHVSTDVAVENGHPVWWRHATGIPRKGGTFDYWEVHAEAMPALEESAGRWINGNMRDYTGMLNLETIGGRIIEVHLRFADQWPDLYGPGWVEALVHLYAERAWTFDDRHRTGGYSVVLFAPHGPAFHHPPQHAIDQAREIDGVSSVQISFHQDRDASQHSMPPGGFRLAIINATDLDAGRRARDILSPNLFTM